MQDKKGTRIRRERVLREKAARVRFGSYEFKKKGVWRFDLRDPYHLAVAPTWPQFLAALFALYLAVNVVFAVLFWRVPGSVVNAAASRGRVSARRLLYEQLLSRTAFARGCTVKLNRRRVIKFTAAGLATSTLDVMATCQMRRRWGRR